MKELVPYVPALLMDFCLGIVITNTAYFSTSLSLSATFIGALMSFSTLFFTLFAIPCGKLSDRIGRSRLLSAGCFLITLVSLGLTQCQKGWHLVMVYPWVGLSQALFWPTYEAWLAERQGGGTLIQRLRLFNLFWCSGITLGPVMSSYLQRSPNPDFPFYLASGCAVLNWLLISRQSKPTNADLHPDSNHVLDLTNDRPAHRPTLFIYISRIANFASWFTLSILRSLTPKLTTEKMGVLPTQYGHFIMLMGSVQLATYIWYGAKRSARWHYKLSPLFFPQVVTAIGLFILGWFYHPQLWMVAFALFGISTATTYFSSMFYGLVGNNNKGTQAGWHEAILGIGVLLGPLVGGWLADLSNNPQSPYLLCSGLMSGLLVVQVGIWLTMRNSNKTDQPTQ